MDKQYNFQLEVAKLLVIIKNGEKMSSMVHRSYVVEKLHRILFKHGINISPSLEVEVNKMLEKAKRQ